ncbi:class I SAM-dependent methyltransferase [Roseovarius aestuarii]|uniref:Glycine/sarcosine/dimethylglycine N-methyltransferase n=1 Tax=Roseovarius aestuarii TaxID=475083 RepID=A0A1X7BMD4_9RHOB|nr:methyltransferase domain-containing protein [Roseovarius aestuarii]SMC10788.1 Glycine/sarcosine/dimethylglycine N-methyltransferase [Roseovarius aestuarii]
MTDTETLVARHYAGATLLDNIRAALKEAGVDPDAPGIEDLKPVDEFHTGGSEATDALLDQLTITADTRVLDIGCGIGGAARHVAARTGAHVRGFDLTPDFVTTATALSDLVGMADQTNFQVGSALDIPEPDDSADLALMFHVGMNIEDKTTLCSEAARVLAPGGTFALFDVMRGSDAPLTYPFPWAEEAAFSFVSPPGDYRTAATAAGFEQVAERDRSDFAKDFFDRVFARIAQAGGPPPVGIHLLMHETGKTKIENYITHLSAGDIAPTEMIFRLPA